MLVLPADHLIRDVDDLPPRDRQGGRRGARGAPGHLRHRADRAGHRLRLHRARRARSTVTTACSGRALRREAGRATAAEASFERRHSPGTAACSCSARGAISTSSPDMRPEIAAACRGSVGARLARPRLLSASIEASFAACPSDSIDYAVMENTDAAAVVPADIGWSDVGSWSTLWEVGREGRRRQRAARRRVPRMAVENCCPRREAAWSPCSA